LITWSSSKTSNDDNLHSTTNLIQCLSETNHEDNGESDSMFIAADPFTFHITSPHPSPSLNLLPGPVICSMMQRALDLLNSAQQALKQNSRNIDNLLSAIAKLWMYLGLQVIHLQIITWQCPQLTQPS